MRIFFFFFFCFFSVLLSCGSSIECSEDSQCPVSMACLPKKIGTSVVKICVLRVPESDIGGQCKGNSARCLSGFCFSPQNNPDLSFCSQLCALPTDCPLGTQCTQMDSVSLCVSGLYNSKGCGCGLEGDSCAKNGHSDCNASKGFFCLSQKEQDTQAVCVQSCDPKNVNTCPSSKVCTSLNDKISFCKDPSVGKGGIGTSCYQNGKADCAEKLFCYSRYGNDPKAYCTRYCDPSQINECDPFSTCVFPSSQDPYLCVPKGSKTFGMECSRGEDCVSSYCLYDSKKKKSSCSEKCLQTNDLCPSGTVCRFSYSHYQSLCFQKEQASLGEDCDKDGDQGCLSGLCVLPHPDTFFKLCSQKCDPQTPCPEEFVCDPARSVCIPITGTQKSGETCSSSKDCFYGVCISNTGSHSFCTQLCKDDSNCPTDFRCQIFSNQNRACLPKPKQNKVGEPCPNGTSDCASRICITDPLKSRTFCSAVCSDKVACDEPYECKNVGSNQFLCTPKDYVKP